MQIYRALLRLYPKSFRAEYGAEMEKDFRRQWHDAPAAARAWLLIGAAVDTVWNASRVHGDITRQDVRYSLRSLRRTPGFSVTVIVVAALGIGAMTGRGEATRVAGATVTPGMLPMLGRQAALGRILTEADAAREAERPIVISDRLWRSTFAASPDVVGQTLTLDRTNYNIIGVMPPDFYFPERTTDFWNMLRFSASNGDNDRGNNRLQVIGRLKPGVSVEEAQQELKVVAANLERLYPKQLE